MSILRKYARPQPKYNETEKCTLSARIPKTLYEEFKEECLRNGYSMSEGIRLLLELDLRGETQMHLGQSETPKRTLPQKATGGRWTIAPYLNPDGTTFNCPLCGKEGLHRSNAARHAQSHGLKSARDLFEGDKAET